MSTPPVAAIEVEDLVKRYEPAGVEALRGISLTVPEGEIFGFLGRNGAGKSTAVRILTTLLRPTSGTVRVAGMDVVENPSGVRRILGVALQEASLDELMTGREQLVLAARLTGAGARAAKARAVELLERFGLAAAGDRIAARYSGGMRRRLDVAMALVGEPRILFLDEPTTGLDPQSRRALWDLIRSLRDAGATVFLTTQYLAEADELADRVGVVHEGRIAAIGSPAELKDRYGATAIRFRLPPGNTPADLSRLLAADVLRAGTDGTDGADGATAALAARPTADGWMAVDVPGGEVDVPALVGRLLASGLPVERLVVAPPTLEDVFVTLTGDELEADGSRGADGALAAVRRGLGVGTGGGG